MQMMLWVHHLRRALTLQQYGLTADSSCCRAEGMYGAGGTFLDSPTAVSRGAAGEGTICRAEASHSGFGARGGGRTHTTRKRQGILSPPRMPFRHPGTLVDGSQYTDSDSGPPLLRGAPDCAPHNPQWGNQFPCDEERWSGQTGLVKNHVAFGEAWQLRVSLEKVSPLAASGRRSLSSSLTRLA